MQLSPSIFKAYDIRGVVPDTINVDVVEGVGRAFGTLARRLLKRGEFSNKEELKRRILSLHRVLQSGLGQTVPLDLHREALDGIGYRNYFKWLVLVTEGKIGFLQKFKNTSSDLAALVRF